MPIPYKLTEATYAYINLITVESAYFKLDGQLWSGDRYHSNSLTRLMRQRNIKKILQFKIRININQDTTRKQLYGYFQII